jgi:hypothetical protein
MTRTIQDSNNVKPCSLSPRVIKLHPDINPEQIIEELRNALGVTGAFQSDVEKDMNDRPRVFKIYNAQDFKIYCQDLRFAALRLEGIVRAINMPPLTPVGPYIPQRQNAWIATPVQERAIERWARGLFDCYGALAQSCRTTPYWH